jgi:hypothetical protein
MTSANQSKADFPEGKSGKPWEKSTQYVADRGCSLFIEQRIEMCLKIRLLSFLTQFETDESDFDNLFLCARNLSQRLDE